MPSLSERILPELILIEPGPERQRMLGHAFQGQRTLVAEARSRLVKLYEAWGKPEEAEKWRGKFEAAAPQ